MAMYKRGDLVWAKMKGFPPWPGIITAPPPELKRQPSRKSTLYYCIFFFGTKNYSWIENHKLERYKKGSGTGGGKRSSALREAVNSIEAYIENGEGGENFNITPEDDAFDKLVNESKSKTHITSSLTSSSSKSSDKEPKVITVHDGSTDEEEEEEEEEDDEDEDEDEGNATDSSTEIEKVPKVKTDEPKKESTSSPVTPATTADTENKDVMKEEVVVLSDNAGTKEASSSSAAIESEKEQKKKKRKTADAASKDVIREAVVVLSDVGVKKVASSSEKNEGKVERGNTPDVELVSVTQAQQVEDPLRVDTIIDLASEGSSSTSSDAATSKTSSTSSLSSTTLSSSTASTPTSCFKSPSTPSTSGSKKKHVQQIVRARPFRQLAKSRLVERRPSSSDREARGSGSGSVESSSRKRSTPSTSSEGSSNSEIKKKKRDVYNDADTTTPIFHPLAHSYARRGPAAHLFDRPPNMTRPETPPLDLFTVSQTLLDKHITPSPLRFGFLGLGIMGSGMVKNLLNSGHRVIVWNRSPEKSREFAKVGAEMAVTPQDVCAAADITFSCVSGPKAAKDMVFGNCGALSEMTSSKAYVEMTNIDKDTSLDIAEAITARGARYLEAQIQGSKAEAEEGTLVILTAGDRSLYNECHSCFEAFGRSSFYLGDVGNASKMNLVIQMIAGISVAGLAEGLALADRCGLQQSDILEVISMTSLRCPLLAEKGKCITDCSFPTSLALSHMQKDLTLGLKLGEELEQPLPITAAANEVYKHSKRLGYGDHDVSAVYIRARF